MPPNKYKSVAILESTYQEIQKKKHIGQSIDGFIQELIKPAKEQGKPPTTRTD